MALFLIGLHGGEPARAAGQARPAEIWQNNKSRGFKASTDR